MNIHILSRDEAENYVPDGTAAIISISSSEDKKANINENLFEGVLPLVFNEDTSVSDNSFNSDIAGEINNFHETHKDVSDLVVNCEAGLNRSAGVALGIAYKRRDKNLARKILLEKKPNSLVFALLIHGLGKVKGIDEMYGAYLRKTNEYGDIKSEYSVAELMEARYENAEELETLFDELGA
ncbi:MAG: hypothetical protein N4A47_07645 [Clostridia bacterium]|jgi:predicted protein tyrosine phosphatase|nr:hypothetical protein [Clostridia bacterium]